MSSPLTTHAQVVSRLAGTAFDRSAVYISDDQAFDLLAVLVRLDSHPTISHADGSTVQQTHFGKLAEDCQLKNASSTPSSGKSTPPFTDASSETSSSSQSSIYACEDKEPDSTLEKAFIDEFSCAYSMADLDWLKNLGDQMYLDPIQSLLDAAFESPIFFTEEAVDFSAGVSYYGVRCDKPPADVPVDCRASSIFCDSSLLEVSSCFHTSISFYSTTPPFTAYQ